jgi:hypothetical protein
MAVNGGLSKSELSVVGGRNYKKRTSCEFRGRDHQQICKDRIGDDHRAIRAIMAIVVDAYDHVRSTSDCRVEFRCLGSRTAKMISTRGFKDG